MADEHSEGNVYIEPHVDNGCLVDKEGWHTLRKNKGTEITPKTEERDLQRYGEVKTPFDWFEEMDRWFDAFRRDFEQRFWGPADPWAETPLSRPRSALVDLVDEGRAFVLKAELPGVVKEDVDIRVAPDGIELKAETRREKEEKEKDYYYRERAYQSFHRTLAFPEEVLPDRAEANLKDGILEVRIPKKAPTPKKEPVKVRVY